MPSNITIYTMTEYDLLSTAKSAGNYYVTTDSRRMYKDISDNSRVALNVTMISTENDRLYNTRPNNGTLYYVWETNCLWLYNAAWILQVGNQDSSNGYYYTSTGQITPTDEVTVLDNNGLLKDGSVVVRDINRIIKGKVYVDGKTNNLIISSYLGGGIQLLPNGLMDEKGSLLINPRTYTKQVAVNRTTGEIFYDIGIFDDIEVYDSETGDIDYYEIFSLISGLGKCPPEITADNYDTEENKEILLGLSNTYLDYNNYDFEDLEIAQTDGYALYNGEFNTTDEMYVNIRYPLNTYELQLMDCTNETDPDDVFSLLKLCKVVNDEAIRSDYTDEEIYELMSDFQVNAYTNDPPKYKVWHEGNLVPEDIILKPEGIIQSLHQLDTPIDLDVDKLDGMDASDFALAYHTHTSSEITDLLATINGRFSTLLPQSPDGKGILVQYNQNTEKYDFIASSFTITLFGGVTGSGTVNTLTDTNMNVTVLPDGHIHRIAYIDDTTNKYVIANDYSNIGSYIAQEIFVKLDKSETTRSAEANKILYLDNEGKLPADITGNAATSSEANKLSNIVTISLSGGVTGYTNFDGSESVDIAVTVDPSQHNHDDRYILINDIGTLVAPVELVSEVGVTPEVYNIPLQYIPNRLRYNLKFIDYLDPNNSTDVESIYDNLQQGDYYVISDDGYFNGIEVYTNDWIVYNGISWDIVNNKRYISSVNGYTSSDVVLNYNDVDAISNEYIDYYNSIESGSGFSVYEPYYDDIQEPVPSAPTGTIEYPIPGYNYTIEEYNSSLYYCTWFEGVYVSISDPVINSTTPTGKIPITDAANHINIVASEADKLHNSIRVSSAADSAIKIIDNGYNITDGTNNLSLSMIIDSSVTSQISLDTVSTASIDLMVNGI